MVFKPSQAFIQVTKPMMKSFFVRALFCFFHVHASTFSLPFSRSPVTLGNETDHLALLAFKDGISGDPNQVFASWNHSLHFCMWIGVTCSRRHTQRVTALNFSSQSLVGSLSPHIGNLSFLRMIDLYSNNFQGRIPQEIGHLFRLERLRLSINSFSGDIPKNLTHCVQLKELHLYDNKLVGNIPFELGSLTKLNRLSLGKNNLVGHIPPWLGNFSSLTQLSLLWNSLEGSIPDELGQLSLDFLMVGANKLSGMIPSSIYNLSSLITFGVAPNYLHGTLPPELGLALPNLKMLYVGGNYFTGYIPRSLGNASGLVLLDLSYNNFTGNVPTSLGRLSSLNYFGAGSNQLGGMIDEDLGFITSLTNCSDLKVLELRNNQFSAMLPFSIANLSTQLQQLRLDQNQIFGTIPSGIENLASLISLGMGANEIIGTIPVHLGKLSKLEKLYLEKNKLSGQLPDSIGNLTRLFELSLGDNNLQGTIPLRIENCQHLQSLGLYNNKLHGPIPKQIFNSRSLILLFLSNNSFVGSLPLEVGTLENLEKLVVNGNKLSGEIPSTLGNCIKLEYLYMGDNFFQGNIPSSLSALKGLKELDLSRNKLHGAIPKYLEQFRFLQYLNLSLNYFEGEVPQQGIFQNTSALSIIGNIKLCGGIPNLHLLACPKSAFKRERGALSVKVIIGIVIPVVSLLLLLSYFSMTRCWWKSSKKTISLSFMKKPLLQVTYADLLKATDGFSSINLIGMGSYGSVYKGIIDHIQTTVAIKVLKLQQPKSSKSFITECKALRSVKHRNIVKILTVCSSIDFDGNDFKALVFEYMPNGSLDMWLHPNANENNPIRNLNLIQRIDVAIDVACALDYLHHHCQEPIVHCDLKPSNVLLDDDMVAHVSDFGLARILSEDEVVRSQTQSSSLLLKGSIGYIAPEYGTGGDVSTYGDIYSYGILLLEMFIGKEPTDKMFKDNLDLLQFAKMAFPNNVVEIIDDRLLLEEVEINRNCEDCNKMRQINQECLVSLVRIGLSCSIESPKERMEMKDVLKEMYGVRDIYLGIGKHQAKHNKTSLLVEGPSQLSNY